MNPITREESLLDGQDLTPITRKEKFIKRIYDKTQEVPTPVTREEYFLKKAGEGTSPVTIEQLNVTENGTYSETSKAYSPVIVEVPAPTLKTKTITENGTYNASEDNADGYSQVTVNVPYMEKKSASGDIASFSDGAGYPFLKVKANINPVQDLHGYDYPWVGGAGKNKINAPDITLADAGDIYNGAVNLAAGTYTLSSSNTTTSVTVEGVSGTMPLTFTLASAITTIQITASGAGEFKNIQIESGSSATSYAPYSNICPISGFTGVDVYDDGMYGGTVNFNQLIYNGNFVNTQDWRTYAADFNVSENVCTFTAKSQYGAVVQTININSRHIFLATCDVKLTTATTNIQFGVGASYIEKGKNSANTTDWQTISLLFTEASGTIRVADYRASGWDAINVKNVMCIDLTQMFGETKANEIYAMERATAGSGVAYVRSLLPDDYYTRNAGTETTISAINGVDYRYVNVSWQDEAGIVYGGYIDLVSGVLTVTKVGIAEYNGETLPSAWISDRDRYVAGNTPTIGAQVVYDLATPVTYQLTPQQINTLISQNNVWNNTNGQTEVEYFIPIE